MNTTTNILMMIIISLCVCLMCLINVCLRLKRQRRIIWIDNYKINPAYYQTVQAHYPHLSDVHLTLVVNALKTFFKAHLYEPKAQLAMPSKVVDVLWHTFILDTRAYHHFCKHAFGYYFHHNRASTSNKHNTLNPLLNRDLESTWRLTCQNMNVNPEHAVTLTALFAIDTALNIPNAIKYNVNDLNELSLLIKQQTQQDRKEASGTESSGCSGGSYDSWSSDCDGDGCGGCGGD